MAHNCVDWTATPPTRKMPLLVLTFGGDHIYTAVPRELKTLEEIARREFNLGDDEIHFSSSCLNLCNGLPARITENAWEHINPYIGCAVVEVHRPRAVPSQEQPRMPVSPSVPTMSDNMGDKHDLRTKRKLQPEDKGEQSNDGPRNKLNTLKTEVVRSEQSAALEYGDGHIGASAPEHEHEEAPEDPICSPLPRGRRNWRLPASEEALDPIRLPSPRGGRNWRLSASEEALDPIRLPSPRGRRNRYRVMSEDEGEGEEQEQEQELPAGSQAPVASPPRPAQPITESNDSRDHPDLQPPEPPHPRNNPVKQEKHGSENRDESWPHSNDGYSQSLHTATQSTQTLTQTESSENHKLMIRVAHRPSKQESKFTTKGTTKVGKVLAGACKSFGLDAGRATMYLIVSTEDEEGDTENLFPCDRNDTIARAGAERETESRFLLKLAGET